MIVQVMTRFLREKQAKALVRKWRTVLENVVRVEKFRGGERTKLVDIQEESIHRASDSLPFFDFSLKIYSLPSNNNHSTYLT